jgi:Ca2+-binding RTX toxin-like protein
MQVTVTGGLGHPNITLNFAADDQAFKVAERLALQVDAAYSKSTPVIYDPGTTLVPSFGYAVVTNAVSNEHKMIDVRGFGAVTIENDHAVDTVLGGGRGFTQTILASDGGLDFSSQAGNVTVVSGGGNNDIDFDRRHGKGGTDTGSNAVYISGAGKNTIVGGDGQTTISAGAGHNTIYTLGGTTEVISTGHDLVKMGSGADTIDATGGGSDTVYGGTSTSTLVFFGGSMASSVFGAMGSVTVHGGSGGGFYRGGAAGMNLIEGGSGSTTILGGGAGDTLLGGTGTGDILRAGAGNETLGGGSGSTTFQFYDMKNVGAISTVYDHITNFNSSDIIKLMGAGTNAAINYALNTYTVGASSSSFSLEDGTKVILNGYTGPLTHGNFT